MARSTLALLIAMSMVGALMMGCGGNSNSTQSARTADDEDDDSYIDEEERDDEGGEDDDAGFVDATLLRSANAEPLTLGEPTPVPGTGVTLRPVSGSVAIPFGSGFLAQRQRVQIAVVVAEGGPEVLEAIRTGGSPDAPEPDHVEPITVAGQEGQLGRDRIRTEGGVLERTWLLAHDGTRGLGVVTTYEADRADAYRPGVRELLESVTWDTDATLDAGVALGIEVGPVDGLEQSHRSTANLVLLAPGAAFPPEPGQAVVTVSPLPMQVPPDQIQTVCTQLAERLVPVPTEDVAQEGQISDGRLPGCERLATAATNGGERMATYAALLFNEQGMPILVTASVAADQLETWRPRFASAARSVRGR